MLSDLAAVQGSGRTRADKYKEFRAVFLGSDQGKRVLHDILSEGHMYRSSMRADPYQTFFREGERNMALKILTTIMAEPQERPTRQRSKPQPTGD